MNLVWGCVALVFTGAGFVLGELSVLEGRAQKGAQSSFVGATHVASHGVLPPAGGPSAASLTTPRGASPEAVANSAGPTPPTGPTGLIVAGPQSPKRSLESTPSARAVALPFLSDRVLPVLEVELDPQAEALIQALLRLRVVSGEPVDLAEEVLGGLAKHVTPERGASLFLALFAYAPDALGGWPSEFPMTADYVYARHKLYLLEGTDQRLWELGQAVGGAPVGILDLRWLETLCRTHPEQGLFDWAFAALAPERAQALFAAQKSGLRAIQRDFLVRGLARSSPTRAAAFALESLLETEDHKFLALAMDHDPVGTAAFLKSSASDPLVASMATLVRLEESHSSCESISDWLEHHRHVEQAWRSLPAKFLPEVLKLLAWEGAWTPLEEQILTSILARGDSDLARRSLETSPYRLRLRYLASLAGIPGFRRDVFEDAFESEPFAAHRDLDILIRLLPKFPNSPGAGLDSNLALHLAIRLQSLGDSEAAATLLHGANEGQVGLGEARVALEGGRSLQDFFDEYPSSRD